MYYELYVKFSIKGSIEMLKFYLYEIKIFEKFELFKNISIK